MNTYLKTALAILGAVAITLQTAYPHAPWALTVTTAVTAVLAALHIAPTSSAAPPAAESPAEATEDITPRIVP